MWLPPYLLVSSLFHPLVLPSQTVCMCTLAWCETPPPPTSSPSEQLPYHTVVDGERKLSQALRFHRDKYLSCTWSRTPLKHWSHTCLNLTSLCVITMCGTSKADLSDGGPLGSRTCSCPVWWNHSPLQCILYVQKKHRISNTITPTLCTTAQKPEWLRTVVQCKH